MKTTIWTAVVAALGATSAFAAQQTLTGMISDSLCGANHSHMTTSTKLTDRECTQVCAQQGAQYLLVSDGKLYKLRDRAADLKTHAGHTVNLTGDVKGDTIKVSKIEMPKGSNN